MSFYTDIQKINEEYRKIYKNNANTGMTGHFVYEFSDAIDIDGRKLEIGDTVLFDPVGDFDDEDFVKDVIVKIKGQNVYLKKHPGKWYSQDLIKCDD